MTVNNMPKFLILLCAVVGVIVLMAIGRIEPAVGMPFLFLATGVGIGNGIAAKKGDPVEPIIGAKNPNPDKAA